MKYLQEGAGLIDGVKEGAALVLGIALTVGASVDKAVIATATLVALSKMIRI